MEQHTRKGLPLLHWRDMLNVHKIAPVTLAEAAHGVEADLEGIHPSAGLKPPQRRKESLSVFRQKSRLKPYLRASRFTILTSTGS